MLIESMRDIGYTLETALADIVDNSITAGARSIRIQAETSPDCAFIAVSDDGRGMTESELIEAMRPGSRSPRDERSEDDLGRFGLGLKTASFSQCRRLTVVSACQGTVSAARWDLDVVAEADDWLVELPDDLEGIPGVDRLGASGTLVVWEKLDRLIEPDSPDGGEAHFIQRLDVARQHLELVFHRFLSAPGTGRVQISMNERPLEPLDPFHSGHGATIAGPREVIQIAGMRVEVQAFTLPHHAKVTPEEWERYAGPNGYLRSQGFYVYRARRLIVHGTWFGLARQTELTKLARVRIDVPNGLDAAWKIDVKKASAQPPSPVRERLRRIIETIGATSRRVYTARGRKLITDERLPVWSRVQERGEIAYRVNDEHPVLVDFRSRLPADLQDDFRRVIELVSAALPMDALFADLGGDPEHVRGNRVSDETLAHAVRVARGQLTAAGVSLEDITDMLSVTEPFRSNWEQVAGMLSELAEEEA